MIRLTALVVAAALAFGGCGALTGRPVETWAQDRGLTARVKARLAAMEPRTLTRIHVDTYENIVYLTGGVANVGHRALRARSATEISKRPDTAIRQGPRS